MCPTPSKSWVKGHLVSWTKPIQLRPIQSKYEKIISLDIPEEGESKRQRREMKKEEERMEGRRRKTLKKHKKSKHKGIGYFCNQCKYQTTTQRNLKSTKNINMKVAGMIFLLVFSILARMEWSISFRLEWNGPFHSDWNGMQPFHSGRNGPSILAGMEWSFHSGRNEMPFLG